MINFYQTLGLLSGKLGNVSQIAFDSASISISTSFRIDGKGFHKFSDAHKFTKPNEKAALDLMNKCAVNVMTEFNEIMLSYGQSDEYSFVFRC